MTDEPRHLVPTASSSVTTPSVANPRLTRGLVRAYALSSANHRLGDVLHVLGRTECPEEQEAIELGFLEGIPWFRADDIAIHPDNGSVLVISELYKYGGYMPFVFDAAGRLIATKYEVWSTDGAPDDAPLVEEWDTYNWHNHWPDSSLPYRSCIGTSQGWVVVQMDITDTDESCESVWLVDRTISSDARLVGQTGLNRLTYLGAASLDDGIICFYGHNEFVIIRTDDTIGSGLGRGVYRDAVQLGDMLFVVPHSAPSLVSKFAVGDFQSATRSSASPPLPVATIQTDGWVIDIARQRDVILTLQSTLQPQRYGFNRFGDDEWLQRSTFVVVAYDAELNRLGTLLPMRGDIELKATRMDASDDVLALAVPWEQGGAVLIAGGDADKWRNLSHVP